MRLKSLMSFLSLLMVSRIASGAEGAEFTEFARTFSADIRPIVVRSCEKCHSTELAEADINLASFASLAEVRQHPEVWQKVAEMLETGQKPPKDAPPPTEPEWARLQQWVRGYLKTEARARAVLRGAP